MIQRHQSNDQAANRIDGFDAAQISRARIKGDIDVVRHRWLLKTAQNLSNRSEIQEIACNADNRMMSPVSSIFPSVNQPNAENSGLAAIAVGNLKLIQDAQQIANPDHQDATGPLVDLSQSRLMTEAGTRVISTENQMLGTLLDAFA
jgi:hypothetical protein